MSTDPQAPHPEGIVPKVRVAKPAKAAGSSEARGTDSERVHSADEDSVGWGEVPRDDSDDERFLREVPPHHGS